MKKEKSDLGIISDAILSEPHVSKRLMNGLGFITNEFASYLVEHCLYHQDEVEYTINEDNEALITLPCGCQYYIYRREVIN